MKQFKVYLAGPITGLSYDGATNWRQDCYTFFDAYPQIVAYSPMREKQYLAGFENLAADCDQYAKISVMSSNRGIVTRDRFDCQSADIILSNLLGAQRVSIGTMIEYGWADAVRRPIVTVMEDQGNVHDHGFVSELTGFRVNNLLEGLNVVRKVLLP